MNKRSLVPTSTSSETGQRKKKQKTSSAADTTSLLSKEDQIARDMILNPILDDLLKNKDTSKRGVLKEVVEKSKALLPWLTTNLLKQRLKRRRARMNKLSSQKADHLVLPTPIPEPSMMPSLLRRNEDADINPLLNIEISISSSSQETVVSSLTTNDSSSSSSTPPPTASPTVVPTTTKRPGRPKGSTKAAKKHIHHCQLAAINETVTLYSEEKKISRKRMRNGRLQEILEEVKIRHNLPSDFTVSNQTLKTRLKRKQLSLPLDNKNGPLTPLASIEPNLVNMAKQMAKCRIPLTCGQGIMMINSCIEGTESQKKLIEFKQRIKSDQDSDSLGTVGSGYWKAFLKRHANELELKKAVKYELERDNFVTYANFSEMYDAIEDLLVNVAKVADKLPEPVWMNENGEVVMELESCGMKNTIKINFPELCITLDEVGGNTSMMKDGNIGGSLYIVPKGTECQQKASKKDKKFTVLGLTAFSGDPVMCVVIIDAKTRDLYTEVGVDPNTPHSIHLNDDNGLELLIDNIGPGKMFPGGPTCIFKEKEIPCMVRFNEGGGINGAILKEIFQTLDALEVFDEDRKQGRMPFVLLDGHQSRFDVEFLEYINDDEHPWCFAIGVPYGTALWQVGDSSQQNGALKIYMSKKKMAILFQRMQSFDAHLGITSHDIIPIINEAFEKSFAKVMSNRKAYCERGWMPFNRNLLLHPQIRATMTDRSKQEEEKAGLFPYERVKHEEEDMRMKNQSGSTLSLEYSQMSSDNVDHEVIQAKAGTYSGSLVATLVAQEDLLDARKRNIDKKQQKSAIEKEQALQMDKKKITAARLVLEHSSHQLGKSVLHQVKAAHAVKAEEKRAKRDENHKHLHKIFADAEAVLQKHNNNTDNINTWNTKDITLLLRTYRQKDDAPIPKLKKDLVDLYHQWKLRPKTTFNGRVIIDLLGDQEELDHAQVLGPTQTTAAVEPEVSVTRTAEEERIELKLMNGGAVQL
jgi:hypothetical protein